MNSQTKEYIFTGPLADYLHSYVKEKQALHFKFQASSSVLKNFDRFTETYPNYETLTQGLIEEWIRGDGLLSSATIRQKTIIIRGFLEYVARIGVYAHIPTHTLIRATNNYVPYIFSESEIKSLFLAADNLKPVSSISHKHIVVPVMIRVIYGCGLRIGEANKLLISDVNLQDGIIKIRQSKNKKSRTIPMSDSLTKICRDYLLKVHAKSEQDDFFFPNVHNEKFSNERFYRCFRNLIWKIGISHGGRGKGPRVHDLRHTFSVHSLKNMIGKRMDLNVALPYLSVYLGHNSIFETQYYLRLTADLFPQITETIQKELGDIIPEVGGVSHE